MKQKRKKQSDVTWYDKERIRDCKHKDDQQLDERDEAKARTRARAGDCPPLGPPGSPLTTVRVTASPPPPLTRAPASPRGSRCCRSSAFEPPSQDCTGTNLPVTLLLLLLLLLSPPQSLPPSPPTAPDFSLSFLAMMTFLKVCPPELLLPPSPPLWLNSPRNLSKSML